MVKEVVIKGREKFEIKAETKVEIKVREKVGGKSQEKSLKKIQEKSCDKNLKEKLSTNFSWHLLGSIEGFTLDPNIRFKLAWDHALPIPHSCH